MFSLPAGWIWLTLEQIAAPIPNAIVDGPFGSNLKLEDYIENEGGVPVLQGKNVTGDRFTWSDVRYISQAKAIELKRSSVRVGDILMVKIGSIGYSAIIDSLKGFSHAIIPANLAKITVDARKVDTGFLHHWLRSTEAKRYLSESASKTAQPALSLSKFKKMRVPMPPLLEQRRIAAILDQAEALRAKRRQALAKLDTLTQSLFDELRAHSLLSFASVADLLKSRHLLLHKDGNHGSQYPRSEDFGETGVAFVSAQAIEDNGLIVERKVDRLRYEKAALLRIGWIEAGDVLLAHNASVGKVSLYQGQFGRALIGTSLTCFRPDPLKLLPSFLAAALRSAAFQSELRGNMGQTTRNQVPITAQKRLLLPLASVEIQVRLDAQLLAIETARSRLNESCRISQNLFLSLQNRAFRGGL